MADAFNRLVGSLDYPMLIVTAAAEGERSGCLVGFHTQTSIDPSRFAVCISRANHTYGVACAASVLGVHVVPEGAMDLAELFGGETDDSLDKFARVDWHDGPEGVPVLEDCPDWFAGRILDRFDTGDHVTFLLDPLDGEHGGGGWLSFQEAKRIAPGHDA